jgi:hypothetical protein
MLIEDFSLMCLSNEPCQEKKRYLQEKTSRLFFFCKTCKFEYMIKLNLGHSRAGKKEVAFVCGRNDGIHFAISISVYGLFYRL